MQNPPSAAMQPVGSSQLAVGPFSHTNYTLTRPLWQFLGRKFHVYAPDKSLVIFVKHPIFKLRSEFTMFADEKETRPLLVVKQREIVSFSAAHDVFDAATNQKLGTIRSRGLKSIVRDTWDLLDANDQPIGIVEEEGNPFLRRMFPLFVMGRWKIELGGQRVGQLHQIWHLFAKEFGFDISMAQNKIDPRFALACALLALMSATAREDASR